MYLCVEIIPDGIAAGEMIRGGTDFRKKMKNVRELGELRAELRACRGIHRRPKSRGHKLFIGKSSVCFIIIQSA